MTLRQSRGRRISSGIRGRSRTKPDQFPCRSSTGRLVSTKLEHISTGRFNRASDGKILPRPAFGDWLDEGCNPPSSRFSPRYILNDALGYRALNCKMLLMFHSHSLTLTAAYPCLTALNVIRSTCFRVQRPPERAP